VAYAASRRRARREVGRLGVQLGLETGLGRDGLTPDEAIRAGRRIAATDGARVLGAWSHLQAPEDRPRTDGQVARFEAAVAALRRAGIEVPHRHLLASGGLLAVERLVGGRRPVFDGLRVGLALYGIVPEGLPIGPAATGIHAGLRPVLSLRARPIRVAELPAGSGIGYGRRSSRPARAGSRPFRSATATAGRAPSRTGPRRWSAADGFPWWGPWRWTR